MDTILALDQASYTTGYSIYQDDKLIKVSHFNIASNLSLDQRLVEFRKKIIGLIDENKITKVVFEDIQLQDIHGNKETGIKTFKLLAELMGVLKETLEERGIEHIGVLPIVWKSTIGIAGKGREKEKKLAQAWVKNHFNLTCTEDEADSACLGYHYTHLKNSAFDWS